LLDLCHLDEAGFAMTLPTSYSWSLVGEALRVPYEAPQGRRVNALGAYFSQGPDAGRFAFESYASVPKQKGKTTRKTPAEIAAAHGLEPDCLGPIDSERLLAFLWRIAGRPALYLDDWRRKRPLWIVLDNYSVHKSQALKEALSHLEAANVFLFYLPAYSPELSEIEPIWRAVKGHGMPYRSHTVLGQMKRAVDDALSDKARQLQEGQTKTTNFERLAA
jgi:putative transposase